MKTRTHLLSVLRARRREDLELPGQRGLWTAWNLAALLLSSLLICLLSLAMAAGSFGSNVLLAYFRDPLILLLNWLPVLLLQLLGYALFGRQWAAFLLTALIVLLASAGNMYKLRFRAEPFMFSDIGAIGAAMGVAHNYDLTPNARILAAIGCGIGGTLFLFFFCRCRPRLSRRLILAALTLLSCWPLWRLVYSSSALYERESLFAMAREPSSQAEVFVSKGFVYPFLHSIREDPSLPPEGYDAARAASMLARYTDADIPAQRQVNVIIVQLESFRDVESWGLRGIRPEAYEIWNALKEESLHGVLAVNNYAGGTANTERGVMAGARLPIDPQAPYPSYVWYLRQQGYACYGAHNYYRSYYDRLNVNARLGFEDFSYYENCFEPLYAGIPTSFEESDRVFFAEILRQYQQRQAEGRPLFSFNVTLQGHYPYRTNEAFYQGFLEPGSYPEELQFALDNYLGTVHDTQVHILELLDALRDDEAPVVVMLYGDHCPNIGDSSYVSTGLGVDMDASTEAGFTNMFTTEYLIWANDAARAALGTEMTGEGPRVSACYLMNVLFDQLGWTGSAFMQFSRETQARLPVVCTAGYYVEDGVFTLRLSDAGKQILRDYDCVNYYQVSSFPKDVS